MFVILTYDVRSKRAGKMRKTALKYLRPVQRSVFEGFLTERRLRLLKEELLPLIVPGEDSVLIYRLDDADRLAKHELGLPSGADGRFL